MEKRQRGRERKSSRQEIISDVVYRLLGGALFVVIAFNLLLVFTFGNCLFWATVNANSTIKPPPGKFQWTAATECTREVLSSWGTELGVIGDVAEQSPSGENRADL